MSEQFDEKLEQFERLWEGVTPNGINRQKSLKFSAIHETTCTPKISQKNK